MPEDNDAIIEDDDVFEMDPASTTASAAAAAAAAAASSAASAEASAIDAKRRTQSLGSLSAEPKSPRKVPPFFLYYSFSNHLIHRITKLNIFIIDVLGWKLSPVVFYH